MTQVATPAGAIGPLENRHMDHRCGATDETFGQQLLEHLRHRPLRVVQISVTTLPLPEQGLRRHYPHSLATAGDSLVGVASGDLVTLNSSDATGTFNNANVGNDKPVGHQRLHHRWRRPRRLHPDPAEHDGRHRRRPRRWLPSPIPASRTVQPTRASAALPSRSSIRSKSMSLRHQQER